VAKGEGVGDGGGVGGWGEGVDGVGSVFGLGFSEGDMGWGTVVNFG